MGMAKRMMMEREENLNAATDYLVSVDELKRCEWHGYVFGGANFDLDGSFYARAMIDRKKGPAGPAGWATGMEARKFTDLLKEAYEDHPADSCIGCDKNAAE